jgi:hypothetical protein
MNLPEDEQDFLRDLVKASRQRPNPVNWVDRDGTARVTALLPPEMDRLNQLAQHLRLNKSTLLQQASFLAAKHASTRVKIAPCDADTPPVKTDPV